MRAESSRDRPRVPAIAPFPVVISLIWLFLSTCNLCVGYPFSPLSLNDLSRSRRRFAFLRRVLARGFSSLNRVSAAVANAQARSRMATLRAFHVGWTDGMIALMKTDPVGEYLYPMPVDRSAAP